MRRYRGYWTKSRCQKRARRHLTKATWRRAEPDSFSAARRNGWIVYCCRHMTPGKKPNNYWTKDRCLKEAHLFQTRTLWQRASPSSYDAACKNHWLGECCGHMIQKKKPNGFWTKQKCLESALKYRTRTDWFRKDPKAYGAACESGWLDECCVHMEAQGSMHRKQLYAFEHPDKSVYVGQSFNPQHRYLQHMKQDATRKNSLVLQRKKSDGGQVFKIFPKFYSRSEAGMAERALVEQYRAKGWAILNIVKAGSLGGGIRIETLEVCKAKARLCKSRGEFKKRFYSAYRAVLRNNWAPQVFLKRWPMQKVPHSYKAIESVARKFETIREFRKRYPGMYSAAWKAGWLKKICFHMKRLQKPNHYWNEKRCLESARGFSSKDAWRRSNGSAHAAARRNGWFEKCTKHMIRPIRKIYWNKERCVASASLHGSSSDWNKAEPSAYNAACKNKWLDECRSNMKPRRNEIY